MTTPTTPTWADRLSGSLLVLIVLVVGLMAGAASFRHVHDWTMHNSPVGTADWMGWANAVITELIPTAALIVIANRRRTGAAIRYPKFLLFAGIGCSLTAQLAVARPAVFGWMVSALPALAFFALSKLVFTVTKGTPAPGSVLTTAPADADRLNTLAARIQELETRPTTPVPALTPATSAPASSPDTAPAKARPVAKKTPAKKTPSRSTAAKKTTTATTDPAARLHTEPAVQDVPEPVTEPKPSDDLAALLPGARIIAEAHQKAHGTRITPGQLAVRLRVGSTTAESILNALYEVGQPAITQAHNGSLSTVPA